MASSVVSWQDRILSYQLFYTHKLLHDRKAPPVRLDEILPVSGYQVKLQARSGATKTILATSTMFEVVADGLAHGTEYIAQVAAANLHGIGDYSAASEAAITEHGELACSDVHTNSGLNLCSRYSRTRCSTSESHLCQFVIGCFAMGSWFGHSQKCSLDIAASNGVKTIMEICVHKPRSRNVCALGSMFVSARPSYSSRLTSILCCSSTTVEDLSPETTYRFRVKAVDGNGNQAVSEPVSILTGRRVSLLLRAIVSGTSASRSSSNYSASQDNTGDGEDTNDGAGSHKSDTNEVEGDRTECQCNEDASDCKKVNETEPPRPTKARRRVDVEDDFVYYSSDSD